MTETLPTLADSIRLLAWGMVKRLRIWLPFLVLTVVDVWDRYIVPLLPTEWSEAVSAVTIPVDFLLGLGLLAAIILTYHDLRRHPERGLTPEQAIEAAIRIANPRQKPTLPTLVVDEEPDWYVPHPFNDDRKMVRMRLRVAIGTTETPNSVAAIRLEIEGFKNYSPIDPPQGMGIFERGPRGENLLEVNWLDLPVHLDANSSAAGALQFRLGGIPKLTLGVIREHRVRLVAVTADGSEVEADVPIPPPQQDQQAD